MSDGKLVAHRGYPHHYPENSLAGIQAALATGARYVEVDVQLSRDGVPVLFHDRELLRLCHHPGAIHDYTWSQLQALDVHATGDSPRLSHAPLVALSDLVAIIPTMPGVRFFIELKRVAFEQMGIEPVLEAVLPMLQPVAEQCCVISYQLDALKQVRERTTLPIGAVIDKWAEREAPAIVELHSDYLFCNLESLPEHGPLQLGDTQLAVFESVDPQQARQLLARGVDLVETFAIGEMRQALAPGDSQGVDCDVLIIGGGIQGVGVAQAAAACGYRTQVLEQSELAAATSSRSSKLIHGGLRYLESGQFTLVRKSLQERRILLDIAPELVRLVPFYIPVYRHSTRGPWTLRAGLSLYALLGGLDRQARFRRISRTRWPQLDGLQQQSLRSVFRYWDAQTDDAALTRAVMASARSLGAQLHCPARFVSAQADTEQVTVHFQQDGQMRTITTRVLINAAGPWVGQVLEGMHPLPQRRAFDLVQGTHIVVADPAPSGVFYVESPQDGRAVFVMPWHGRTLIGTTETAYTGDPAAVAPQASEIDYLRRIYRHYFPAAEASVVESFAGLRVLPHSKSSLFDRPRDTLIDTSLPRVVSLYGGKLTGYRATAQAVMHTLRRWLPEQARCQDTAQLPLEQVRGTSDE
ncbi:MAG: FAD-dependent oxidoreductase [Thiohalophilus sp.]|uniref:FAD-dependent oxidoreductase n=1 Tax=Thiohalophilus sp. TaxID=3028392 RepID=UPI0028705A04|nr:FAD-dependent oxidoreductase [Thiohalophilus sp.]MDR9436375.1 FAD-dependent oxidoreductase [Thiohalophilus sp.]